MPRKPKTDTYKPSKRARERFDDRYGSLIGTGGDLPPQCLVCGRRKRRDQECWYCNRTEASVEGS